MPELPGKLLLDPFLRDSTETKPNRTSSPLSFPLLARSSTEAERARQVLHDSTRDLIITKVETTADEIVFVDLKEGAFVSREGRGRKRSSSKACRSCFDSHRSLVRRNLL